MIAGYTIGYDAGIDIRFILGKQISITGSTITALKAETGKKAII